MNTDTPRPERATLTAEERHKRAEEYAAFWWQRETGETDEWADLNAREREAVIENSYAETVVDWLAAHEQALREEIGVIAADALTIAAALVRSQGEERTHVVDGQKRHLSTIAKGIHQRLARIARGETR